MHSQELQDFLDTCMSLAFTRFRKVRLSLKMQVYYGFFRYAKHLQYAKNIENCGASSRGITLYRHGYCNITKMAYWSTMTATLKLKDLWRHEYKKYQSTKSHLAVTKIGCILIPTPKQDCKLQEDIQLLKHGKKNVYNSKKRESIWEVHKDFVILN